jgi:flagellar hook-associated protein 3 FlgL
MTMRVGTETLYRQSLANMQRNQADAARAQNQLSSGVRVQRAGDDPTAFAAAQRLDSRLSEIDGQARSSERAMQRLSLAEVAVDDAANAVGRIRELMLRAGSPTLSPTDRQAIEVEVRQRLDEVYSISNRQDGDGNSLFAGHAPGAAYVRAADGSVSYAGDDGQRLVSIAQDQTVADGDPGPRVFGAAGDDAFTRIEAALAALAEPDNALRSEAIGESLRSLDETLKGFDIGRARIGSRLSAIDNAAATREAEVLQLKTTLGGLRDTDVAVATTELSLSLTRLEASQLTYLRVQQQSLFSMLR